LDAKTYADKNVGFAVRENSLSPVKNKLSEVAVRTCVKNGDVVMLDASTTAMHCVKFLSDFDDLIVITSGLKSLLLLAETTLKFYSTGGKAINGSSSFVGQTAINAVSTFNADVCLISCHGVAENGFLTDTSESENDLRRAMLKQSKRKVLLIDSTKINKSFWHNLCNISEFDDVFCDAPLPEKLARQVKNFHLVKGV
jgi:DeoR/GlpR family transcriptional regulator of sugar metabolism